MRHLRADYDAIQPWPSPRPHIAKIDGETQPIHDAGLGTYDEDEFAPIIPDDEPVFVLRAMDQIAPGAVRDWAMALLALGGDEALADRVLAWADEMESYAHSRGGPKVPDTPSAVLR